MNEKNSKSKRELTYRRIVVKLGTHLLTDEGSHLDQAVMADLARQVAQLHERRGNSYRIFRGHHRREA